MPEKARTIGELLAEASEKCGVEKLTGHDIMTLERFDPGTRHMIDLYVLSHESPMGYQGDKMRLFLTEQGYQKALTARTRGLSKLNLCQYIGHKKQVAIIRTSAYNYR